MTRRGFTVIELLVLIVIIVVLAGLLWTPSHGAPEIANRAVCGANIRGMYQAMYTYSETSDDWIPAAGQRLVDASAIGLRGPALRGRTMVTTGDSNMANNVTASLWLMVRNGSTYPKAFICPSSGDTQDPLRDADDQSIPLSRTWDFWDQSNLSYSPVNMYHIADSAKWSGSMSSEWVIMGDDNNATGHTFDRDADTEDIREHENSLNHRRDGQNLLYGDGHVSFDNNPFVGPDSDNVYAQVVNGHAAPPTLGNNDGDRVADEAVAARDVMLVPISGNSGVSLSGKPATLGGRGQSTAALQQAMGILLVASPFIVGIVILLLRDWLVKRARRQVELSGDAPDES